VAFSFIYQHLNFAFPCFRRKGGEIKGKRDIPNNILRQPRSLRVRILRHIPRATAARGKDVGFEGGGFEGDGVEVGGGGADVA
jgi:hypothetical protein